MEMEKRQKEKGKRNNMGKSVEVKEMIYLEVHIIEWVMDDREQVHRKEKQNTIRTKKTQRINENRLRRR